MKQENDFVLPEKWCVKHHPETLEWIRNNAEHNGTSINKSSYYYFPCDDSYSNHSHCFPFGGYSEITLDQFKEHVLKEVPNPEYDPKDVAFNQENDWAKGEEMETVFETKCGHVYTENKKIIGYKLIKPEYLEAVNCICKRESRENKNFLLHNKIYVNSDYYSKIKDAEILHWFEEIFDTSITLKSGVKLSEDDIAEVKEILKNK